MGDLLDPPVQGPEGKGVPQRALPDELLVELTQTGARLFEPQVEIAEGLPRFVEWYRAYHGC